MSLDNEYDDNKTPVLFVLPIETEQYYKNKIRGLENEAERAHEHCRNIARVMKVKLAEIEQLKTTVAELQNELDLEKDAHRHSLHYASDTIDDIEDFMAWSRRMVGVD